MGWIEFFFLVTFMVSVARITFIICLSIFGLIVLSHFNFISFHLVECFHSIRMILIDFLWGYTKSGNSKQCICAKENTLKSWCMIFTCYAPPAPNKKITQYLNCCAKIRVKNSSFLLRFISFGWHSWVQSERKLNLSLSKHENDMVCVCVLCMQKSTEYAEDFAYHASSPKTFENFFSWIKSEDWMYECIWK